MKKTIIICITAFLFILASCQADSKWNGIEANDHSSNKDFEYISKSLLSESDIKSLNLNQSIHEDYVYTYEKVKVQTNHNEFASLGVNSDILYPGALINTKNGGSGV